jgi:hypothetical protein
MIYHPSISIASLPPPSSAGTCRYPDVTYPNGTYPNGTYPNGTYPNGTYPDEPDTIEPAFMHISADGATDGQNGHDDPRSCKTRDLAHVVLKNGHPDEDDEEEEEEEDEYDEDNKDCAYILDPSLNVQRMLAQSLNPSVVDITDAILFDPRRPEVPLQVMRTSGLVVSDIVHDMEREPGYWTRHVLKHNCTSIMCD